MKELQNMKYLQALGFGKKVSVFLTSENYYTTVYFVDGDFYARAPFSQEWNVGTEVTIAKKIKNQLGKRGVIQLHRIKLGERRYFNSITLQYLFKQSYVVTKLEGKHKEQVEIAYRKKYGNF